MSLHRVARFAGMVGLLAVAPVAAQTTYIVNTLLDSIDLAPGNGVCMDANGLCSLRAAVMEANATAGVVHIRFAVSGTHTLTLGGIDNTAAAGDLDINPVAPLTDLFIFGNGIGTTIVSASGLPAAQPDRVFHLPAGAPANLTLQLNGLTVRDGRAQGATGTNGGGVLVQGGRLLLDSVEIRECSASNDGGGLWSDRSVTVQPVTPFVLTSNSAGNDGGGMFLAAGSGFNGSVQAELNSATNRGGGARVGVGVTATFVDLVAQFNVAAQGGALANSGTTVISFLIAAQNQAVGGGNGGAMANQNGGSLTIAPTGMLLGNQAANGGGAINNQFGCTLVLDGIALRSNTATNLGGAISNAGDATVTRSEFSGNASDGLIANAAGGGAVYNQNSAGRFRAVNCTFSGNIARFGFGGAIANDFDGRCELSACSLVSNRAASGHSLFNGDTLGSASVMQVLGTIIDSAPSPPGNNVIAPSPVLSAGFNINVDGTGMLPAPGDQFGTIPMPIATMLSPLTPCGTLQAHFPLPGSPAIDKGFCADLAGHVLVDDQCLNPRPLDGDGNGIADCDVGAIEAPMMPPVCPTCRGDMDGDNFVDGRDMQRFVDCLFAAPPPIIAPGCHCADMDADSLLDPSMDVPLFVQKTLGIGDPNPVCP